MPILWTKWYGFRAWYSVVKDKYKKFKEIESPFTTMPDEPITYSENKDLVCIPRDYMSDSEIRQNITRWLDYAQQKNYKTVALTGVRDSSKTDTQEINLGIENDDNRVIFIVGVLTHWLTQNQSQIREILLIAMSDNYTRNFKQPVNLAGRISNFRI